VIFDREKDAFMDQDMLMFFMAKNGKVQPRSVEHLKQRFGFNWVFHQRSEVDIGIMPFGFEPDNDDVLFIPDNLFLSADQLYEISDVFFLSYQPGTGIQQRISPIARSGIISLMVDQEI
jgi:hypothetical protein